MLPHETRGMVESDRPFVFDGWIRSYQRSRWAGVVPNHLFWDVHRVAIEGLLTRGAVVTVAHLPGEPDALLGFVAHEVKPGDEPLIHTVYVKPLWRRQGVARALIDTVVPDRQFHYTFRTDAAAHFKRPAYRATFAPERARRKDA